MAQITLYLDDSTEERVRAAAKAAGVSLSQWVGDLVRQRTATQWPAAVVALHGAWADFPTAEDIRASHGEDARRETL